MIKVVEIKQKDGHRIVQTKGAEILTDIEVFNHTIACGELAHYD